MHELIRRLVRAGRRAPIDRRIPERAVPERASHQPPPHRWRGSAGRPAPYAPLRPWQVRGRRFAPARFGRRGVDPAEVRVFLDRVAYDLTSVYAELARVQEHNARITDALRRWRSRPAPRGPEAAR